MAEVILKKEPVDGPTNINRIVEGSEFDDVDSEKMESSKDVEMIATKNRERFAIKKTYSLENGYQSRTRNLVEDAKFETRVNEENKRNWLESIRQQSEEFTDDELGDDDVFLLETIADAKESKDAKLQVTLVFTLKDTMTSLSRIIKIVEAHHGNIAHLETRETLGSKNLSKVDALLKVDIQHPNLINFLKMLKRSNDVTEVRLISSKSINIKVSWFPRQISDLDQCNHLMTKFEPELDMDHPGWNDKAYRERRQQIAELSFKYKYGQPIPRVEYLPEEVSTWGEVFKRVVELLPGRASTVHRKAFEVMKKECGYSETNIPQLEEVSNFLKRTSGFTIRPAAGLVTARDFLASLAFRVFQCTQYVRHYSRPHYSPEPDVIHELLGHCPMFADPLFAQFSQEIGLASLAASDGEVEKLATLYWFTVEFGLCREKGELRAYGAGLLSSYGELLHSLSDVPEFREFDPASASVQEYDDQAYQNIYYVAESFEDAMDKFRRWVVKNLCKPVEMRYNPYTQTIEVIDSVRGMENLVTQMRLELNHLNGAMGRLKFGS